MTENHEDFCPVMSRAVDEDWFTASRSPQWERTSSVHSMLEDFWQYPEAETAVCVVGPNLTVEERFHKLADEWSCETGSSSSMMATTRHPKYAEIIDLGWDVLPVMLMDLQTNHRFWFPALYEITHVRPFDESDVGNGKRMIQAWVEWGKRKKLI